MADHGAEGTQGRYIDLALVAVACTILLGAHFFGAGQPTGAGGDTGVDFDTIAPALPDTSPAAGGREALGEPEPVDRARSLVPGVRDADAVKSDLRNVVIVQEVYFSEHSRYATPPPCATESAASTACRCATAIVRRDPSGGQTSSVSCRGSRGGSTRSAIASAAPSSSSSSLAGS